MAPSVDSHSQQTPLRKKAQTVESEVAVRAPVVERAPDVEALVQETLQSTFGNAIVAAALDGADIGGLGEVLASEIAATSAGMGAMSEDGTGLLAVGNAAMVKAAKSADSGRMGEADALNALRGGGGQQLPTGIRAQMEAAFGRSFAGVRVHTDTGEAAAALGAEAVAMGSHLHFADGQYDPGSTAGKSVIAHELTHVMQAQDGRLPGVGGVSNTSMAAEREAYANESMVFGSTIDVDGPATESVFASDVSTGIDVSSDGMGSFGSSVDAGGFSSGSFGMGAASLAPLSGMSTASAAGPVEAATSAPAMLRESDAIDKEESDTEASARHEVAMGLGKGFSRAIDMSQGAHTANVSKEGTGRKDGVFTGPSQQGHLGIEEYNAVMRDIGPDGQAKASGADEFLVDSAQHTQTANDGHVHLDNDHRLGATPETTATGPGGDPVMGGEVGGMVSGSDKAGMHGDLGGSLQRGMPPGQSRSKGPMDSDVLNAAIAGTFGKDVSQVQASVDDAGNKAIGARASTQNNQVSFRSDIATDDLTDKSAMETVGHEMAHALAGGGTSQNAVDQDGDKAEATADRAGKQFAEYVSGGMKGPAPRLSAAVGGAAKRHRQRDSDGPNLPEADRTPARGPSGPRGPRVNARGQGPEVEVPIQAPEGQERNATFSASGVQVEAKDTESGGIVGAGVGTDGLTVTGGTSQVSAGITVNPLNGTYGANVAAGSGNGRVMVNGNITHQDLSTATDTDGVRTQVDTERRGASGGIAVPVIGISGGTATNTTNTVQATGETAAAREARAAEIQGAQEEGTVLSTLAAGESAGTSTSEASSLNGFVGASGFAVGVGRSDAVSTGIVANRDAQGNLSIDYNSAAIQQTSGSLTYAGFGVGAEAREGTNHDVRIDVDEASLTDEGRAELESSLRTGVLPGAHDLESDEAVAASSAFSSAQERAADLQAQLDAVPPGNNRRRNRDRQRLRSQLASANEDMQSSRNTLNEEWRSANDAGAEVMPGVTVQREIEAETEGGGVSVVTPLGSANIHSEDDTVARTTEVREDGTVVETHSRETATDSWFSDDRRDGASYDSEGNVTLSTTRDIVQGSTTGNLVRELEGDHNETVLGGLGDRERRQTARGTRMSAARSFADVTVTQELSAADIQAAGAAQNAEDGADERFSSAGDRVARLYTASTESARRNNLSMDQRLGRTIAQGGEVDGVAFDRTTGMSAEQVAEVYGGIESPQDLAALRQSHPENYTALQANFARASVAGGALDRPEDVVGMLSSIDDPQARAQTTAEVMHMLNERGDDASIRMMAEFQRLGESNPQLQASIAGGMSTSYTPPPASTTGRRQRRPTNYTANRDVRPANTSTPRSRRRRN